ncbi:MAG: hypothetical protein NO475_05810 [Candidatus Methanomethylicia archaeon]|nr:hypothetical protein [Candidatus Methanomethylicia archaeon]MCQ5341337.1 hypothetical protein [Candidatus Methanomethylicia archaeon]
MHIDSRDLEKRLTEFKGFGPVAINIFLRELRGIWNKANPKPSDYAKIIASKLGINNELMIKYESQLVRLYIEYCKFKKCNNCLVENLYFKV